MRKAEARTNVSAKKACQRKHLGEASSSFIHGKKKIMTHPKQKDEI